MVQPHGNELVDRRVDAGRSDEIREDFDALVSVTLDENLFFDFVNIARGVYSPLRGFLSQNDFLKVVDDLTLEDGVLWPLPIVLDVNKNLADAIDPGTRIGFRGPDEIPVGVMDVDDVYRYNLEETCQRIFDTADRDHPGVEAIEAKGPFFVGGEIKAFGDATERNGGRDLTPKETRVLFKRLGWDKIVGYQTRNVPHRAHEYLQKSALEHVDGLFVQPKIGEKKSGDYADEAILRGYETLLSNYYPEELVVLSTFNSRMWYAGPREAIFDAIVRKNYGCTHFIIGRDHAGVGDYYDDFEAQELFEAVDNVGITPLYYSYAFYCTVCEGIVSEKTCPHGSEYHEEPSGTKLRALLNGGEKPATELMRPEVAESILQMDDAFVEE
jgi:sulfate adenylyltransferase